MRPIKFRAWDKERLCWVDKFYIEPDGTVRTIGYTALGEPHTDITDKVSLVQFTGLKDKNGKEIYEGDILKQYDKTYEVYYINGHFMSCNELWEENTRSEVIGNIYENPELLK